MEYYSTYAAQPFTNAIRILVKAVMVKSWKQVERKVAELLNGERKPVTGRKGEDIIHPLLYPDVKSRVEVPKTFFVNMKFFEDNYNTTILSFWNEDSQYLLWRLKNTDQILNGKWGFRRESHHKTWPKLPFEWFDHIASTCPKDKIPVVILHRSYLRYEECLVLASHHPLYTHWIQKRLPLPVSTNGDNS